MFNIIMHSITVIKPRFSSFQWPRVCMLHRFAGCMSFCICRGFFYSLTYLCSIDIQRFYFISSILQYFLHLYKCAIRSRRIRNDKNKMNEWYQKRSFSRKPTIKKTRMLIVDTEQSDAFHLPFNKWHKQQQY